MLLSGASDELRERILDRMDASGSLTRGLVECGVAGVTFRAAHFAASLGERGLDFYERALLNARDSFSILDAFHALNALAARRGEFARRVRGLFSMLLKSPPENPVLPALQLFAVLLLQNSLDDQISLSVNRVRESEDELRPDVARTFALTAFFDSLGSRDAITYSLYGAALAGRTPPEYFFLSEEVLRLNRWKLAPADLLEIAKRRGSFRDIVEEGPPAARPQARNAPCPCGSGKKYKRCCGAT